MILNFFKKLKDTEDYFLNIFARPKEGVKKWKPLFSFSPKYTAYQPRATFPENNRIEGQRQINRSILQTNQDYNWKKRWIERNNPLMKEHETILNKGARIGWWQWSRWK